MQFSGKTVEDAISLGLEELNLSSDQVEINVIEEPTKGLFGKLKGKAVVEITKKATGAQRAVEFIDEVLNKMDLTAKAELNTDGENPVITLIAENSSEVIGYRGEVLDALQTLASAIANIGNKNYKKVVVDCEGYRNRREDTLINLAKRLEAKATEMKREVILEPMSPYERRIIHTTLSESQTVTTRSDGKEPNRYVVIVPNEKDEYSKPYNAGRNSDKKGKNDNNKRGFNKNNKKGRNDRPKSKSGFTEEKRKTPSGFGTFIGNSRDL